MDPPADALASNDAPTSTATTEGTMDPPADALVSNDAPAPASTATTESTMHPHCRPKSDYMRCLASARRLASKKKRATLKTYTKARCREIMKCLKVLPEPHLRHDEGAMNAFYAQHAESVEILLAETGEEMPDENNFLGDSLFTIDESDNPKLLFKGKEIVCEEDMYDVVARAFEQAVQENRRAKTIGRLITKAKDMFGENGRYNKIYYLRAESLNYLNQGVPEPTSEAPAAAEQPEAAIVPVHAVTLNGASTSVPEPTAAAAQPGTVILSMPDGTTVTVTAEASTLPERVRALAIALGAVSIATNTADNVASGATLSDEEL